MGKVIIEFDSVEEQDDIRDALDGYKWRMVAWELDQFLRSEIKYNEKLSSIEYEFAEKTREELRNIINEFNLNLEQ
jgi:DNA-directed RNA polymerase subunit F